jgi:peptidoglycan/LPS O-acetylase OafA/YrhL
MSHAEFLGTRRFPVLDGLRALAILMVFTAHPRGGMWPPLHGSTGVTLFFVLSGFLITTLLLREEDRDGRVNFRAFYLRRTFRIYPMFFAVFFLYCVLVLVLGMQPERRASFVENIPYIVLLFPEHMTFLNDWPFYPPFNGAWSIGIEEKFYLVWPVIAFAALVRWRNARLPVLVLLSVASLACSFVDSLMFLGPYQHLGYGAMAALLLHGRRSYPALARLGRPRTLLSVTAVAVVAQFATAEVLPYGDLYGFQGMLITLVLIGLVTTTTPRIGWLSSRPLVFLATISYAFYLLHNFFLNGVESVVPATWGVPGDLASASIAFVLSVLASWVVHRAFEEPMRLVGVRLSNRVSRKSAPAPAPRVLV